MRKKMKMKLRMKTQKRRPGIIIYKANRTHAFCDLDHIQIE